MAVILDTVINFAIDIVLSFVRNVRTNIGTNFSMGIVMYQAQCYFVIFVTSERCYEGCYNGVGRAEQQNELPVRYEPSAKVCGAESTTGDNTMIREVIKCRPPLRAFTLTRILILALSPTLTLTITLTPIV